MNSELLDLIRDFQAISRSQLAESGRILVGTLCLASPVELVEAIGAIPTRIMSSGDEAELRGGRFLASDSCSFCKAVLGGLELGNLRLDAVLGSTTCDQMRRNLEIIARDLKIPVFIFNAPRTSDNPFARDYAKQDIIRLFRELYAWSGVTLELEVLKASISRRQLARQRVRTLMARRESAIPGSTGAEFHALMTLYQSAAPEDFDQYLTQIEQLVNTRKPLFRQEPLRLALLGSCLGADDVQVIDLVEETGRGVIVYDAVCTGTRALAEPVNLPDDPFDALVELYHDQVLCPHKRPNDRLFDIIAQDVKRLNVQGVIYKTLKFCHPWGFEARRFKEILGLPLLHLDHDYSPSATGQLRTRIHAFLEQLSFRH